MRKAIAVLWCVLLLGGPPSSFGASFNETGAANNATFIDQEVARGREVFAEDDTDKILSDPYAVSALYYSAAFFRKIGPRKNTDAPQNKIMLGLSPFLNTEMRERYMADLARSVGDAAVAPLVLPLDADHYKEPPLYPCRECHPDAIDLFTKEGSRVRSVSHGIVVLAIGGWEKKDQFTTVSRKGGNEVIIFDPATKRFYRYCHLDLVTVTVNTMVSAGQYIGTVGHTGVNASRPGHGDHLHFEINQYSPAIGANISLSWKQLAEALGRMQGR